MSKLNRKTKFAYSIALSCIIAYSPVSLAVDESIVQVTAVYFGNMVNRTGSCSINATTGALTSGQVLCVNGHTLGHFRVIGDPNKGIKIKLKQGLNIPDGLTFNPEVRITNNLGLDVTNNIAGTDTWVNIGTDGLVSIYVGGSMTLSQVLTNNLSYFSLFDIEVLPQ